MRDAWQTLRDAGLPIAAGHGQGVPDIHGLAAAARAAVASRPSGRDAEALAAFLCGWLHHWPQAFATAFGPDAPRLSGWADQQLTNAGRYLKLRRLAIANLAQVL